MSYLQYQKTHFYKFLLMLSAMVSLTSAGGSDISQVCFQSMMSYDDFFFSVSSTNLQLYVQVI